MNFRRGAERAVTVMPTGKFWLIQGINQKIIFVPSISKQKSCFILLKICSNLKRYQLIAMLFPSHSNKHQYFQCLQKHCLGRL